MPDEDGYYTPEELEAKKKEMANMSREERVEIARDLVEKLGITQIQLAQIKLLQQAQIKARQDPTGGRQTMDLDQRALEAWCAYYWQEVVAHPEVLQELMADPENMFRTFVAVGMDIGWEYRQLVLEQKD